jgi:hypothetical protein
VRNTLKSWVAIPHKLLSAITISIWRGVFVQGQKFTEYFSITTGPHIIRLGLNGLTLTQCLALPRSIKKNHLVEISWISHKASLTVSSWFDQKKLSNWMRSASAGISRRHDTIGCVGRASVLGLIDELREQRMGTYDPRRHQNCLVNRPKRQVLSNRRYNL